MLEVPKGTDESWSDFENESTSSIRPDWLDSRLAGWWWHLFGWLVVASVGWLVVALLLPETLR